MVTISKTKELIDELRMGHMIIIMDDENRENEGDVIFGECKLYGSICKRSDLYANE